MTKAKVENYTLAQTADIVERYTAVTGMDETAHNARAKIVEELAIEHRGSIDGVRSVRSKLVREGVYIKKGETSTVTGEKPEKKEVIAQRVADAFGVEIIVNADGVEKEHRLNANSLEKMNKTDLAILFHRFNSEIVAETEMDETEMDGTETAKTE